MYIVACVVGGGGVSAPIEGFEAPLHEVQGRAPRFFIYENPIIVGQIQAWGENPNIMGVLTHGFVHGVCTWFWA